MSFQHPHQHPIHVLQTGVARFVGIHSGQKFCREKNCGSICACDECSIWMCVWLTSQGYPQGMEDYVEILQNVIFDWIMEGNDRSSMLNPGPNRLLTIP